MEIRQHARRLDRYTVVVEADGGDRHRLTLSDEAVLARGLRVGGEIGGGQVALLVGDAESLRARDIAVGALSRRSRSARELEQLLLTRGVNGTDARGVTERLRALGVLDDARFAADFVRSRVAGGGASVWLLRRELARRGISRRVADSAIAGAMADEAIDERDLARRAAEKKMRTLARTELVTARRRLTAYLRRRGFSADVVRPIVRELTVS